jgi:hypothetical protein
LYRFDEGGVIGRGVVGGEVGGGSGVGGADGGGVGVVVGAGGASGGVGGTGSGVDGVWFYAVECKCAAAAARRHGNRSALKNRTSGPLRLLVTINGKTRNADRAAIVTATELGCASNQRHAS